MTVRTVLGTTLAEVDGRVLVHEHIYSSFHGAELDPVDRFDRQTGLDVAVRRMLDLREHGVALVLDATPIDLGRDAPFVAEVARRSGMHIACSTGFYLEHAAMGIPFYWRIRSAEEIAELFLHEIANGIGDTGIRPGVIKVATGNPPTAEERKVVRAAALAAATTGLPIITHCENAKWGLIQQDLLMGEGVRPERILIGHFDPEGDFDEWSEIASRGSYVGVDRIGITVNGSDEDRASVLVRFHRRGFGDRICLSHDAVCCLRAARRFSPSGEWPRPWVGYCSGEINPAARRANPASHLFTTFVPRLLHAGLTAEEVEACVGDNPKRFLFPGIGTHEGRRVG